jgi:hypothetical protein
MFSWIRCPVCGHPAIGVCCDMVSAYLSEESDDGNA